MINKTNEYDIFKYKEENRKIDKNHVKRLEKSISRNNLLEHTPVLVDENYYIIDGQHRLEAAKKLKIPIYYKKIKNDLMSSMISLNTASKVWSLKDYARTYSNRGIKDYENILKISEEFNLPISSALILATNRPRGNYYDGNSATSRFKEGLLSFSHSEYIKALEILKSIMTLEPYVDYLRSTLFIRTILKLLQNEHFSIKHLHKKMFTHNLTLHKCSTEKEYLRAIEDCYNYNTYSKNKVRLYN